MKPIEKLIDTVTSTIGYWYKCQRCDHDWPGRNVVDPRIMSQVNHPRKCPNCSDPNWQKPAKIKQVNK